MAWHAMAASAIMYMWNIVDMDMRTYTMRHMWTVDMDIIACWTKHHGHVDMPCLYVHVHNVMPDMWT